MRIYRIFEKTEQCRGALLFISLFFHIARNVVLHPFYLTWRSGSIASNTGRIPVFSGVWAGSCQKS